MGLDPTAAKLGTAAIEASVKVVGEGAARPQTAGTPEDSPFKQLLGQMDSAADAATQMGISPADLQTGPGEIQALSAEGVTPPTEWLNGGAGQPSGADKVVDLLSEVNYGQMRMDNLLNEILYGGRRFSNQELLAIQAHIYHFAQLTELTVKVAEQGVSSVKSILNTQVQ